MRRAHPTRYLRLLPLLLLLSLKMVSGAAQEAKQISYTQSFEYDQEYGLHREKGQFTLSLTYDGDSLRWQADQRLPEDHCRINERTDQYILATSADGTPVFYNVREQQLFYMMKWETTYTMYGVGAGPLGLRESVQLMMHVLEEGTIADVTGFLKKQASYDF
ncbi:MAG: hypothetical protein AAGA85_09295 [Bacteroidota bacterium]